MHEIVAQAAVQSAGDAHHAPTADLMSGQDRGFSLGQCSLRSRPSRTRSLIGPYSKRAPKRSPMRLIVIADTSIRPGTEKREFTAEMPADGEGQISSDHKPGEVFQDTRRQAPAETDRNRWRLEETNALMAALIEHVRGKRNARARTGYQQRERQQTSSSRANLTLPGDVSILIRPGFPAAPDLTSACGRPINTAKARSVGKSPVRNEPTGFSFPERQMAGEQQGVGQVEAQRAHFAEPLILRSGG